MCRMAPSAEIQIGRVYWDMIAGVPILTCGAPDRRSATGTRAAQLKPGATCPAMMADVAGDTISLAEAERDIRDGDGSKTGRRFLDFAVNGEPLASRVRAAGYDVISCLSPASGWTTRQQPPSRPRQPADSSDKSKLTRHVDV